MSTVRDHPVLALLDGATAPPFPVGRYDGVAAYFEEYAEEVARAARSVQLAHVERAAAVLIDTYTGGKAVFSCGNGGSAAIANHLQCDHLKGIRTATDISPRVVSLSANVELVTAIANDMAYEDVFAYQLQSQAAAGDALIAVSSSGNSPNILRAVAWARANEVRTIALTGFTGGDARTLADVCVHVDAANYGIVEDVHQAIMHALAQYIRQSRMTDDVIAGSVF
jgi:D-sedoheptulose 7-phosphate isomerase/D-glycero-D-manno-heptose 1,7-bisphosphate phosphatase